MTFPIFAITDGDTRIDLLKFLTLVTFKSSVLEPQSGTWGMTPFADGRVPIDMTLGNLMIEATLSVEGCDQDVVASKSQKVRQLLENARQYWLSPSWKTPVWVEMQGSTESHTRYAYIYDYRAPGSGNPFGAPMFDINGSLMIFPLILETTAWQNQPFGEEDCIAINTLQLGSRTSTTTHFHTASVPLSGLHDFVTFVLPSEFVISGGPQGWMGYSGGQRWSFCNNFRNVTIPKGATIVSAFLRFTASGNSPTTPCNLLISAERLHMSPTFKDYTSRSIRPDYFDNLYHPNKSGRPYHNRVISWTGEEAWTNGNTYDSDDIADLIQVCVNEENWEDTTAIGLKVSADVDTVPASKGNRCARTYEAFSPANGDPELHVVYVAPGDAGQEDTCEQKVFISNKHNYVQITHVFRYDASGGGSFTDLMTAGWPQDLFPTVPGVGDALYCGIDSSLVADGQFRSLVFDLSVGQYGLTISRSYSQTGGAFVAVPHGNTDNTNNLSNVGVHSYHFEQPVDFDHTAINGVDAWWFKFEITAMSLGCVVPTQQNRDIYTILTPFFEIDESQVKGDLPLLARTKLYNRSYGTISPGNMATAYAKKIFLATRRKSRGEYFTPYLNASYFQLPWGMTCDVVPGAATIVEDTAAGFTTITSGSPAGRTMFYHHVITTASPLADRIIWYLDYSIAKQYLGRFAVYVRCAVDGAGLQSFNMAVKVRYGLTPNVTEYQTRTVFMGTEDPLYTYIDTLSIGEELLDDEFYSNLEIRLMIGATEAGAYAHLYVYDLILLPIDEMLAIADTESAILAQVSPWAQPAAFGVFADIDSILNPKTMRINARTETVEDFVGSMNRLSRNPWMLNPRTTQRVWFFSPGSLNISYLVQQFGVSRYLDLRGSD